MPKNRWLWTRGELAIPTMAMDPPAHIRRPYITTHNSHDKSLLRPPLSVHPNAHFSIFNVVLFIMVSCTSIFLMLRNGELSPIKTRASRRSVSDHSSFNSSSPTIKTPSLPNRRHSSSDKVADMLGLRDSLRHSFVPSKKDSWDSYSTGNSTRHSGTSNELAQLREVREAPPPFHSPRQASLPSSVSTSNIVCVTEPDPRITVQGAKLRGALEIIQPSKHAQSFSSLAESGSTSDLSNPPPQTASPGPVREEGGEEAVSQLPPQVARSLPTVCSWSSHSGLSIATFVGGTKFIEGL